MTLIERATSNTSDHRIDIPYGLYRIIAGRRTDAWYAIGYLGMRKIDVAMGDSLDDAISRMKQLLDQRLSALHRRRIDGVPSAAEFKEALDAMYPKLPERMAALVALHSRLLRASASLRDLSRRSGLDEAVILADYIRFGRRVGQALQFAPRENRLPRALWPILTVGEVDVSAQNRSDTVIKLRRQILEALGASR